MTEVSSAQPRMLKATLSVTKMGNLAAAESAAPVFLYGFPAELKAFYMKKSAQERRL
jgi:aspartyl/asparaginyl-tRNA synthetase